MPLLVVARFGYLAVDSVIPTKFNLVNNRGEIMEAQFS
jgi:hypothetical protein